MPKFAVSNIALSAYDHVAELNQLSAMGLQGLEVAPSCVWLDTWSELTPALVNAYAAKVKAAGLEVVGLHSLLFDHPELGLFRDSQTRRLTLDFMAHLSAVCRDLGGRTLIYGGGRKRGELPLGEATDEAIAFFGDLLPRIESHGTCFCFEPLGVRHTDFINSAFDSLAIVKSVNHQALQVQLDAKALVENHEATQEVFSGMASHLVHFHANEPDLGVLGSSGKVDHQAMGNMLRQVGYNKYVTIEQRLLNAKDPLADVAKSIAVLKECYQ